ncbi:DUF3817 domain-containing protein [Microbacterium schleiferi]|uniref:DUF3817 domain-containing protein n=1 Tax=Microbacterium schleiferi TaxID=69362 RepID=UPI003CCA0274
MTPRRFDSSVRVAFRTTAIVEAFSWLALLTALVVKYPLQGSPLGVTVAGWVHGIAWIAFLVACVAAAIRFRWAWWGDAAGTGDVGAAVPDRAVRHLDGAHAPPGEVRPCGDRPRRRPFPREDCRARRGESHELSAPGTDFARHGRATDDSSASRIRSGSGALSLRRIARTSHVSVDILRSSSHSARFVAGEFAQLGCDVLGRLDAREQPQRRRGCLHATGTLVVERISGHSKW